MIEVQNLDVRLPGFALEDISLRVPQGAFGALIGPTGSGKSILLEALAGLQPVKRGQIFNHRGEITRLPPERRGFGLVYQDAALFPHLNVRENLLFARRYTDLAKAEVVREMNELSEHLGITHLLQRDVRTLSGGETQRVALVRALLVRPSVLLLDEPLSALDPVFREEIQYLLQRLHQEMGLTMLMVTHNFEEVVMLAEQVAVIHQGRFLQKGAVQEVFTTPRSPFVARFVGMKNLLAATPTQGGVLVAGHVVRTTGPGRETNNQVLGIRPEDVLLAPPHPGAPSSNAYPGSISAVTYHGVHCAVRVECALGEVTAHLSPREYRELGCSPGDAVTVILPAEKLCSIPA